MLAIFTNREVSKWLYLKGEHPKQEEIKEEHRLINYQGLQ